LGQYSGALSSLKRAEGQSLSSILGLGIADSDFFEKFLVLISQILYKKLLYFHTKYLVFGDLVWNYLWFFDSFFEKIEN
jgi:hypothetical protein